MSTATTTSFTAQGAVTEDQTESSTIDGGTASNAEAASSASAAPGGSASSGSSSSSSGSSTEIESETKVANKDGSVTTTIVYMDGTQKVTTTAPDPAKADRIYTLTHPDSAGARTEENAETGMLYSGTV